MDKITKYLTKNQCYQVGAGIPNCLGAAIHSTATPGATPEGFASSWNVYHPGGTDIGPHPYTDSNGNGLCDKCGGRQTCVHAFADDTKVIDTLPYNIRCWGLGSGVNGNGNDYYVQIEMCEPKGIYFDKYWNYKVKPGYEQSVKDYINKQAGLIVEWIVDTLLSLGIKEVNTTTVTSHYEAYQRGIACNHGDPKQYLGLAGLNMNIIRNRAKSLMNEKIGKITDTTDTSNKNEQAQPIKEGDTVRFTSDAVQYNGNSIPSSYKVKEYKVKQIRGDRVVLTINNIVMYAVRLKHITKVVNETKPKEPIKDVNYLIRITEPPVEYRAKPDINSKVTGTIKSNGIYTIVKETSDGWGLLKSGAGWIYLASLAKI